MESKRSSNDIVLVSIDEDRESSNENGTVTYHTSTRSSLENNVDTENSNNRFGVDDGIRSVSNSNNPIIIAIKPILCILKVFGVYYSVPDNSNVINTHYDDCRSAMLADCQLKKKRTRRTIFTPLRLYSLAVCFLLWINAGRFGANVFIYQNTSWMPFVILYVLWLFQVAGNVSLYYYMCHRKLPILFNHISKIQSNECQDFLACIGRYTRKRCIYFLIPATIFASINIVFPIFSQFGPITELRVVMDVINSPWQNSTVFPYVYIFAIHVYCTIAWIYPMVLFCLCCLIMAHKFHTLTKRFKKAILRNNSDIIRTLAIYREQHQAYCVITELLSDTFSLFIGYLYVTNLAKACFNLYRLIFNWSVNGLLMNITLIIWFIATTGMTIITSWVASILNAEAHSPISVLYSLQTRNIGNDGLAELLLFQSRLLAEPIGISIVGMFVITRSLILTPRISKTKHETEVKVAESDNKMKSNKFSNDIVPLNINEDRKNSDKSGTIARHISTRSSLENNVDTENSNNRFGIDDGIRPITNSNDPIIIAIKPILCILKVFGIYYSNREHRTSMLADCQLKKKRSRKTFFTPLRIYGLAVCLVLWINTGRFWANIFTYQNTSWMPFVILYVLWLFQVAGNVSLYYYMCHRKLPILFKHISKIQSNESQDFLACIGRYTRKRCIYFLIPATIFASINIVFPIFSQFGPITELRAVMDVINSPWQNSTVFPYVYIFAIHVYCTIAWIYPMVLFCLCCLIMAHKFHTLTKRFKKAILRNNSDIIRTLAIYREQHLAYCVITELLSDTFSLFIGYLYVTNLAIACFNLYRLIFNWSVNGLLMNIILIIWFIATTGMTIIISWVASILNAEVQYNNITLNK
ncbi:hypothetical protein TrispH2_002586 [Trichoplax sp. H2]|nr:hypothetical protein TrispH2_002586 [Trichoplax sp. H2]|eukprot:RDD45163.1 hypothetical protein TrispH2_002586 [Trichoplax sp. H2]